MKINLRILYLYLFSAISLVLMIYGGVSLVNLGFKTFIFPNAGKFEAYPMVDEKQTMTKEQLAEQQAWQDRETKRNNERDLSSALSLLIVGAPIYFYHWGVLQKEEKKTVA